MQVCNTGSGGCLFHAFRRGLTIRMGKDSAPGHPYFPVRYLRRMIAVWLAQNRQQVMVSKGASLSSQYGVEGGDACKHRLSFQGYLIRTLERGFWGDDTHLYALAKMFRLTITVLFWNLKTFEERRVLHSRPLSKVDVVLLYDGHSHFHAAGTCILSVLFNFFFQYGEVVAEVGACSLK